MSVTQDEQKLTNQFLMNFANIDFTKISIDQYRNLLENFTDYCCKLSNVDYLDIKVPSRDNYKISTRIFNPQSKHDKTLFFFPGNAFIADLKEPNMNFASEIARKSNCKLIYVNFRLCPEHHISKSFDDCYDAVKYFVENHLEYAINKNQIILSGISSGARIAASIANKGLKNKQFNTHSLILLNASYNFSFYTGEFKEFEKHDLISSKPAVSLANRFMNYNSKDEKNEYISPFYINDFTAFPTSYVIVSEYDGVRGQSEGFYKKLKDHKVSSAKIVLKSQTHNTPFFLGKLRLPNSPDDIIVDILKEKYSLNKEYIV